MFLNVLELEICQIELQKMENNIKSIEKRLEELVKSKDELLEKFFYEEERLNELFKL